ncbi:inorganic triphosphatase YgiF [Paucimonas lemoignei]|uniref:Inorganic triphosphatase YgiF n=1 Tax=Paucimonas lemoignei TaxID=29443 RepID=A0A4R3HW01_PAULE|nr:CYTH and CHAD domain-containing protein [Paucimonas lemoignei]TCS37446.1 inorganic triphosphatase YgiF [Paucimonas lemoignei]
MEVELKLTIDPRHAATLRQLSWLQAYAKAPARTLDMADIYFDTADLAIRNSNAGLRVREVDGARVQTLKGGGGVASGLHSRHEWESTVAGPQPELDALRKLVDPHSAWAKLLEEPGLDARLEKAFTTSIKRTVWDLQLPDGDLVELALDEGSISCRDRTIPVSEIELELKSGLPEHLFDLGLKLMEHIPLRLATSSKAARGYDLFQAQVPTAVRARPIQLAREMNVEDGVRVIVTNCLAQIQGNEAAVLDGHDPDAIHQMRVGLRRLRSTLKLFGKLAPCPPDLLAELCWLGDALGEGRDWEVLVDSTLPRIIDALPEQVQALTQLHQACAITAQEKRRQAIDAVASPRFATLALNLGAWLTGKRWRDAGRKANSKKLQASLPEFSDKVLKRRHATLLQRGRRLARANAETRHRLRIAAKQARYAGEFCQSLYPPKRIKNYVAALTGLQDALGWLNDAAVAADLLKTWQQTGATDPALAGTAEFVRGYLCAAADMEQPELLKLWTRFTKTRQPYR